MNPLRQPNRSGAEQALSGGRWSSWSGQQRLRGTWKRYPPCGRGGVDLTCPGRGVTPAPFGKNSPLSTAEFERAMMAVVSGPAWSVPRSAACASGGRGPALKWRPPYAPGGRLLRASKRLRRLSALVMARCRGLRLISLRDLPRFCQTNHSGTVARRSSRSRISIVSIRSSLRSRWTSYRAGTSR